MRSRHSGSTVTCPGCGASLIVPGEVEEPPAFALSTRPRTRQTLNKRRTREANPLAITSLCLGIGAALASWVTEWGFLALPLAALGTCIGLAAGVLVVVFDYRGAAAACVGLVLSFGSLQVTGRLPELARLVGQARGRADMPSSQP